MSNTLAHIIERKRQHVATQKARTSYDALCVNAAGQTPPRGFHAALKQRIDAGDVGLIAEIKKASPSRGIIRADFNVANIARSYTNAGAACLSVLTDAPYFHGDDAYLLQARAVCELPVLRKDFMIDPYQIMESRALGADCILLIMAALSDAEARDLETKAHALGMDVLIEVHDEYELTRALSCLNSRLLGINNRSLKTLEVTLATSEELRTLIPNDYTVICESGIASHNDILRMRRANMHGFLVGESLMREANVEEATRRLLGQFA